MSDPLESIRCFVAAPSDAVRWACILEATAAKPGNVFPGAAFEDLSYLDFIRAAETAADWFGRSDLPFSERVLGATQETHGECGSNVNLGILLLLGPLAAADESIGSDRKDGWLRDVQRTLDQTNASDAQNLYRAIAIASPGGLGAVDKWDVNSDDTPSNIIEAMQAAESYDRVAKQYACGFADLLENVVPVVSHAIAERGDVLSGITRAQVRLLQSDVDSHIVRKDGEERANEVQQLARRVNLDAPVSIAEFDYQLRLDSLNPGTTADLIAAALYVLLRTPIEKANS